MEQNLVLLYSLSKKDNIDRTISYYLVELLTF